MMPHQNLAHYRINCKLGEGGMGEVWRATDTKLNREVAIKILPETFARDGDRMARFAREAQVLASLNHPHIAAIYGVEERALVMELVEGPTLAERIEGGPIPLDEALAAAKQIAEALEYAHERGVVHRDLKPANIKISSDGRIKILDFGLAKAIANDAPAANPLASPTVTMGSTQAGVILGTAAYMAPEQARGQNVDRRADIWAFGVVITEMLTGLPVFAGPTLSDTLAAVLKSDVDLSGTPAEVRPIIERCLRKDPRRRWRCIGDARIALEEGLPAVAAPSAQHRRAAVWPLLFGLMAIACAAGWILAWRATRVPDKPLIRVSVDLGPEALTGLNMTVAISPDGRRIVFPVRGPDGKQALATRLLDQPRHMLLPGTEAGIDPFFSSDGQWIGFFASGQLKKTSVQGGAPIVLASTFAFPAGGSWSDDGSIVAAMGVLVPLSRIPSLGGQPQPISRLAPEEITHRWPQVLPGRKAVLFTASPSAVTMENANIEAIRLNSGEMKVLQRGGYYGRYVPGDHLLYVSQGTIFGVKFDPDRLQTLGAPTPLVENVAANLGSGGGQFAFSDNGTFLFTEGKHGARNWQIAWLDRSGKTQPLVATAGSYAVPRFAPDGRKLALIDNGDVYIYDPDRDATVRVTFTGGHAGPAVWAPDGKHIAFESAPNTLSWIRSDGAGDPQPLLQSPTNATPWDISADGRHLAYFESNKNSGFDIWTLPLDISDPDHPKPGKPELFLRSAADQSLPRFSPDGRWIAYRSSESGIPEIYVRPFPAGNGGKWQVSSEGALYPLWSKNGHELFFETVDNRIMVADYGVNGATFTPGKPRLWVDRQLFYAGTSNLDLAPDGGRFAVLLLPQAASAEKGTVHVTMLLNFFDELKRRIP